MSEEMLDTIILYTLKVYQKMFFRACPQSQKLFCFGENDLLSQIELVWVRVRVEWECFWVNLREDNKVSESKMAVSESNMAEFKMAAIIK